MSQENKICQNCKNGFVIEPEDFDFYEKINPVRSQTPKASADARAHRTSNGVKVPPPTFCPECRAQRRLAFRNGHSLYKRKCDLCGAEVVSRVSPDKIYPMYCKKCWWSDKWDGLSYGRIYDFSLSFFEQFKELLVATPHISIFNSNVVNSEWVNQETDDKNCYLNVGGHFNEDSAYNTFEVHGKNCFDNFWVWQCELCYENINCERCYKTLFSRDCSDCLNTIFSFDCRNCQNVFGCVALRNKQYYIFNKPYSKEEFQKFFQQNPISSYKNLLDLQQKIQKIWFSAPHRPNYVVKCNNASGCYVTESKNVVDAWWTDKAEDSKYLYITAGLKDCYDATCFGWGEICYEICGANGLSRSKFCTHVIPSGPADKIACYNLEYCFSTPGCNNCFGCCNLKGQEYCILNKKYSKNDYETVVAKIRQQMMDMPYIDKKGRVYKYGEFFPAELSPFGYNETTANDYYPLNRDEVLAWGYNWSDYESDAKYEFSDFEIPDDIKDVKDDILEKVLKCEVSGKAYRIIPMELQFYRQMGLPIPKRAPLQRYKDRMSRLLPRKLFQRQCQCAGSTSQVEQGQTLLKAYQNTCQHEHGDKPCPNTFQTFYSPDRPEIVYCEECYLKEVV